MRPGNRTTAPSVSVIVANDVTAPTVSVIPVSATSLVAGIVTVVATATDDVGVAGVRFSVDGAPLGAEDTTAPYELAWNTATVANGFHTVTVVARDEAGNVATASALVIVMN